MTRIIAALLIALGLAATACSSGDRDWWVGSGSWEEEGNGRLEFESREDYARVRLFEMFNNLILNFSAMRDDKGCYLWVYMTGDGVPHPPMTVWYYTRPEENDNTEIEEWDDPTDDGIYRVYSPDPKRMVRKINANIKSFEMNIVGFNFVYYGALRGLSKHPVWENIRHCKD